MLVCRSGGEAGINGDNGWTKARGGVVAGGRDVLTAGAVEAVWGQAAGCC